MHDTDTPEFQAAFKEAAESMKGEPPADLVKPVTEAPAPAAPAADAPAPAGGTTSAEPQPEDEVARLRRELQEAQHRERSASSRVSAFHRKLNEVQQELQRVRQAPPAPAPAAESAAEDQALEDLKQEMPEVAKLVERLVEKRVAPQVAQVEQRIEETVKPLREDAEQRRLSQELQPVEQEFPDWNKTIFSDEFEAWKSNLPPALQDAWGKASTGQDALYFLRLYRDSKAAANPPPPAPAPSPQDRLARAVGIPARGQASPTSGLPPADDFEGNFAHFAAQMRRQA